VAVAALNSQVAAVKRNLPAAGLMAMETLAAILLDCPALPAAVVLAALEFMQTMAGRAALAGRLQ
jgi:hypothetical protein